MNRGLAAAIGVGIFILLALNAAVLITGPREEVGVPSATPTARQVSPSPTFVFTSPSPSPTPFVSPSPSPTAAPPSPTPTPAVTPTVAMAVTGPPMSSPLLILLGVLPMLAGAALLRSLRSN